MSGTGKFDIILTNNICATNNVTTDVIDTRISSNVTLRSEEHTSELQSHNDLVCRLLLEKKKKKKNDTM